MQGYEIINKRGFALLKNYFESPNFVVFSIYIHKNHAPIKTLNYYLNKNSMQVSVFEVNSDQFTVFDRIAGVTDENEFIFVTYPNILLNDKSFLNDYSDCFPDLLEGLSEMDNPVMIFCKF